MFTTFNQCLQQSSDYLLDFHCNPYPAMCFALYGLSDNQEVGLKSHALARAFGITTIEMRLDLEAHRTGTMMEAAHRLGKPMIVVELFPWRRIDPLAVEVGVRGALNVMKSLEMIVGEPEPQEGIVILEGKLTRVEILANTGGIVIPVKGIDEPVSQGEIVGMLMDGYGDVVEEFRSPVDGWLLAWPYDNQAAGTGDLVAMIALKQQGRQ